MTHTPTHIFKHAFFRPHWLVWELTLMHTTTHTQLQTFAYKPWVLQTYTHTYIHILSLQHSLFVSLCLTNTQTQIHTHWHKCALINMVGLSSMVNHSPGNKRGPPPSLFLICCQRNNTPCVSICVCVFVWMCACVCLYMCVCVCVCMYVCFYAWFYVYLHVSLFLVPPVLYIVGDTSDIHLMLCI